STSTPASAPPPPCGSPPETPPPPPSASRARGTTTTPAPRTTTWRWEDGGGGRAVSVCPRDGHWFLKLLQAEVERMEGWCQQMEHDEHENELPDEILGKIRSAVGSAQLLMAQKFQQFRELCEENLNPNAHPRPVSQDLAGFWDMLQLSIENISLKFDELHQLKANNWRCVELPEQKHKVIQKQCVRLVEEENILF
uniref:Discs, large (Drosophila) homolog-associated protein 4a n=1 Tax=Astyanax mexicanus TaxID=7994 RepID=A0A8B9GW06_ASTMX